MFGQTISSGGGQRGRKKGSEVEGHKWVARIGQPGNYKYFYSQQELNAYKSGKATANGSRPSLLDKLKQKKVEFHSKKFQNNRYTTPEEKAAYERRQEEFNRTKFKRHAKSFVNRQLKKLDFNGDGKTNLGDARYKIKNSKAYRYADANGNNRLDREDANIHLKKLKSRVGSALNKVRSIKRDLHNKRFQNNRYTTPEEKAAYERRKNEFERKRFMERVAEKDKVNAQKRLEKAQKYRKEASYDRSGKDNHAVNSYNLYKNIGEAKYQKSKRDHSGSSSGDINGLKKGIANSKYQRSKQDHTGTSGDINGLKKSIQKNNDRIDRRGWTKNYVNSDRARLRGYSNERFNKEGIGVMNDSRMRGVFTNNINSAVNKKNRNDGKRAKTLMEQERRRRQKNRREWRTK